MFLDTPASEKLGTCSDASTVRGAEHGPLEEKHVSILSVVVVAWIVEDGGWFGG